MIRGCDVSNWQGVIDWPAVAASGIAFAFAKASEGADWTDPTLVANAAGMRAADITPGFYHFARPSLASGHAEAAHFLSVLASVGGLQPGDMMALDLEDEDVPDGSDLLAYALDFMRSMEMVTGLKPLLYSRVEYMQRHGLTGSTPAHQELASHGLWLAAYGDKAPDEPEPFPVLAFWQRSSQGWVPGVAGPVDLDVFFGNGAALALYGLPQPVPTPMLGENPQAG